MSDAFEVAWALLKSDPRFQAFDLRPTTQGYHPDLPHNRAFHTNLGTVDPNVMAMVMGQGYAARRSRRYPEGIGQGKVSRMMNEPVYGPRYPLTSTGTMLQGGEVTPAGSELLRVFGDRLRDTMGFESGGANQISRMPRPHAITLQPPYGTPQRRIDMDFTYPPTSPVFPRLPGDAS
jgi:hypothetical protein